MKRTPLRRIGRNPTAVLKEQIQATLRDIAIKRDKGCILRNRPEAGKCGGYRTDGELILQYEHLNSRSHAISFSDSRLGVCLCQRHHIYFKPQHSQLYWELIEQEIGTVRWSLLERVRQDKTAYKKDLKLELVALKQQLQQMS